MNEKKKQRKRVGSIEYEESTPHDSTPADIPIKDYEAGIPAEQEETNEWNIYSNPYFLRNESKATDSFYPSSQAWPWTDLTEKKWEVNDYVSLWKDKEIKKETKLKIDDEEIKKISEFNNKYQCHSYRLSKINILSLMDTFLVLFDNILKILPVVILSSLPLFILANSNSVNYDRDLVILIYALLVLSLLISLICRWLIKKHTMAIEQYLVIAIKKEEELVNQQTSS